MTETTHMGLARWLRSKLSHKPSPPAERACLVYVRGRSTCVTGLRAGGGSWCVCEPIVPLAGDASSRELGRCVLACLAAPQAETAATGDISLVRQQLCQALGASSWTSLASSAVVLEVRKRGHVVIVTPTQKDGHGGLRHLPEDAVTCLHEAAEVGNAVRTAARLGADASR